MANARHKRSMAEEQTVPATEIVRHFSAWQDRSNERPITILHHGRPRSVLLSLDRYSDLIAGQGSQNEREEGLRGQLSTVLARMQNLFIAVDRNLYVTRINRAATTFLKQGATDILGQPLAHLFPKVPGIVVAAQRVIGNGLPEALKMALDASGERQFLVDVTPFPGGAALFCTDVTRTQETEQLRSWREAEERLLSMMTGCAVGEIGKDGMLTAVHPTLRRLLRFPASGLSNRPFCDLFEVQSRRKCRLHVTHVLDGKGAICCRADIVTRDRGAVAIRLFLAPKMAGDAVQSVIFSILDDSLGALPMR